MWDKKSASKNQQLFGLRYFKLNFACGFKLIILKGADCKDQIWWELNHAFNIYIILERHKYSKTSDVKTT